MNAPTITGNGVWGDGDSGELSDAAGKVILPCAEALQPVKSEGIYRRLWQLCVPTLEHGNEGEFV
ncbi:MAG: hypothetical protein H8E46_11065 [FCB group bacterium]|nr:hypothetical protein [FCB group bacterium]